jgi:hypothetical protein
MGANLLRICTIRKFQAHVFADSWMMLRVYDAFCQSGHSPFLGEGGRDHCE